MRTRWTESEVEAELSANQNNHYQSLSNLEQEKQYRAWSNLEEKLAEAIRQYPQVLYDKSCKDFKDNNKKKLAWEDVAKQVGLQTGMYCSSEYSFICLMFSLVRIMLLYGCSFLGFFRLGISYRSILSAERLSKKKKTKLRLAECGMGVKMERDAEYENTRNFNGGIRDELEYFVWNRI